MLGAWARLRTVLLLGAILVSLWTEAGEAADAAVDERLDYLEQKVLQSERAVVGALVVGLLGLGLSAFTFVTNRRDRKIDRVVKEFETHYESALQSALERVEASYVELGAAAETASPEERIVGVENIWRQSVLPAMAALHQQLLKLDESNNVGGDEWSAAIDESMDRAAVAVDTLLDASKGVSTLSEASAEFSGAFRELVETVKSKLIAHKRNLR